MGHKLPQKVTMKTLLLLLSLIAIPALAQSQNPIGEAYLQGQQGGQYQMLYQLQLMQQLQAQRQAQEQIRQIREQQEFERVTRELRESQQRR